MAMAAFKTNFQSAVPFSMAMAAFTTIRPSTVPFKNPFVSLIKFCKNWNAVRQTRETLNNLSARELADIGMTRGDIENFARRARA
ncbi:MAG: hypothetical protein ACI94O_001779 [Octadecabacter sp.]|jgi:uncharacterized protein YjiS (DUF1127 family)